MFYPDLKKVCVSIFFALVFALVNLSSALAKGQKVVLLTSLDTKEFRYIFNKDYYRNYLSHLETLFRHKLADTLYEVKVVHQANQSDLWRELHDPRNVALFWLSHASGASSAPAGLEWMTTHKILDVNGFEVTPLFEKVHPNLRFLAVVGCFSKDIIETLPQLTHDSTHPVHPYLRTFTFHNKVDAKKGLSQALEAAKNVLTIPEISLGYVSECPKLPGYHLEIRRSFSSSPAGMAEDARHLRPAVRIMSKAVPVGVFPEGGSHISGLAVDQIQEIFVPHGSDSLRSLDSLESLRVDAGENAVIQSEKKKAALLDLGSLDIQFMNLVNRHLFRPWSLWTTPDGKPIGIFTHVYQVRPEAIQLAELSQLLTMGTEYPCAPMPSYR